MCGYDPFEWYEKELDEDYKENQEIITGTDDEYEKVFDKYELGGLPGSKPFKFL